MPRCITSPSRVKALLDTVAICKLRLAGFSFAEIGRSLDPPVSKQYVHQLFWKAIHDVNLRRRKTAEHCNRVIEACKRMDEIDPP